MSLEFGSFHFGSDLSLDDSIIQNDVSRIIEEARSLVATRTVYEGITVDPEGAKDLDDGFSFEATRSTFRVGVHIPNAGAFIMPGVPIYDYALSRCVTVYRGDYNSNPTIPMLPRQLSEEALSLLPGIPRPTISIITEYDHEWNLLSRHAELAAFQNVGKLSYLQVEEELSRPDSKFGFILSGLFGSALALYPLRSQLWKQPKIDLNQSFLPVTTEDGSNVYLPPDEKTGHFIVQEHMISAGMFVSENFSEEGILSRNHLTPSGESVRDCIDATNHLLGADSQADLYKIGSILRKLNVGDLPRATYGVENLGHYGLGLYGYTHFTSPLRRLAEYPAHIVLHANLSGVPVEIDRESLVKAAAILTEKSQAARNLQRGITTSEPQVFQLDCESIKNETFITVLNIKHSKLATMAHLSPSLKHEIPGLKERLLMDIDYWTTSQSHPSTNLVGAILFSKDGNDFLKEVTDKLLDKLKDPTWGRSKEVSNYIKSYLEENELVDEKVTEPVSNNLWASVASIRIGDELVVAEAVDFSLRDVEHRMWIRIAFAYNHREGEIPILSAEAEKALNLERTVAI